MKKVFLAAAVVSAFSFASCKKAKTCSCTTTETKTVTNYSIDYSGIVPVQDDNVVEVYNNTYSNDVAFDKISKKYANENCPKTVTTSNTEDNVDTYNTNGTESESGSLKRGNSTTTTATTTCSIK